MSLLRNLAFAAATTLLPAALPAAPADLPPPAGEVLLTVSGDLEVTNQGDTAAFDLEMLRALGETRFTTATPWTDTPQEFTGVSLQALMARLGVAEGELSATAINDYSVQIPVADAVEGGPIIAYLRGGAPMSVRDKGPLWVVYPYDAREEYRAEVVYGRSIWQLDRLVVAR